MLCSSVYQQSLVAFVVDEAHCVKMWYVLLHTEDLWLSQLSVPCIGKTVHIAVADLEIFEGGFSL